MENRFSFHLWSFNRMQMPDKHILVCEDDISQQKLICNFFEQLFGSQGRVQLSIVLGAVYAFSILGITNTKVDLILLDYDLPHGNGAELIQVMKEIGLKIPIITFSGIPENNNRLMALGADYNFNKEELLAGKANEIIKDVLRV